MGELLTVSFAWVNLPFTLALGVVILYWVAMILGVAHDGHSDLDADGDADLHGHDMDGAHDADGVDDAGMGAAGILLRFLHADEVPLTAVMSVLALCMWAAAVLGNWYLNPSLALGTATILLVPELLVAMVATRVLLIPAAPLLRQMHVGVARKTVFVGQVARVKSEDVTDKTGQAELMIKNVSVLLNVRTTDGARLVKGDSALLVAHDEARGIYEVTKV